jgi:hypothetical protein
MNHSAFPARLHAFQIVQSIPLSQFFCQDNAPKQPHSGKVNAFIIALRKNHKNNKGAVQKSVSKSFQLTAACWLRFTDIPDHAIAFALEYQDETGHWLQPIDEIRNITQFENMFSGEIIFKSKQLHHANLVCSKLNHGSVFIDDITINITALFSNRNSHKSDNKFHNKKAANHK